MWNADGTGLYYLSDRDGEENIWYMTLEGDEETETVYSLHRRTSVASLYFR